MSKHYLNLDANIEKQEFRNKTDFPNIAQYFFKIMFV